MSQPTDAAAMRSWLKVPEGDREAIAAALPHDTDAQHAARVLRQLPRFLAILQEVHGIDAMGMADQPTTCDVCGDKHRVHNNELGRDVPCTSCPLPCPKCAVGGGHGPYCATTPCPCDCHQTEATKPNVKSREVVGVDVRMIQEAGERAWMRGHHAAYRAMLGECLKRLHGHEDVKAEVLLAERVDALAELRDLCEEAGDLEWDERTHLADIIRKHLGNHISGSRAFITLDRESWRALVEVLESHELSTFHPSVRGPLLRQVRDEARVPDSWRERPLSPPGWTRG